MRRGISDNCKGGIRVDNSSLVTGNTAIDNTALGSRDTNCPPGQEGAPREVEAGFGLDLRSGPTGLFNTGYANNIVAGNTCTLMGDPTRQRACTVRGGIEIGTNLCDGSTTCP
jgi:hypothetical protein